MATTYSTPGVYVEEISSGMQTLAPGATAVAAFVGFTAKAPKERPNEPRLVTNWSQFVDLYGERIPGAMLPHAVYGYFNNGGSLAYIVRIDHTAPSSEPGVKELNAADRKVGSVKFETKVPELPKGSEDTAVPPQDVSVTISREEPPSPPPAKEVPPTFRIQVSTGDKVAETFEGVTLATLEKTINEKSKMVAVKSDLDADRLKADLSGLPSTRFEIEPATPTALAPTPQAFAGSERDRTGINGLVIANDVTMVMVPDLVNIAKTDGKVDLNKWKQVQLALIDHCNLQKNRMAILDAPPGMTVQEIKEWQEQDAMYNSPFATLYYPWITIANPNGTNGDSEMSVPPSGHIAGVWARTDNTRGVWKAPANEGIAGVLKLERNITHGEQGLLNPMGINCIRKMGTRGILVWGARTLSKDTDWTYINVRRLFNMIESTIMEGTQFAVFEPNDQRLWEGLKRTVSAFLRGLWRDGALFGATAEQAFYVKCDEETNPPESIDLGKVVVEIGIAPVKPAEFVIFRIAQTKSTSA